jgi:uncharacterized membrane protein
MSKSSNNSTDHTAGGLSDHQVEQLVGRLLQIGVLISAVVVIIGGLLIIAQHGSTVAVYSPFRGEPAYLRSLSGIFREARAFDSLAIAQLGLVLLIATPLLRVAFTLVAFAIQRDRTYVLITLIVLVILMYGLLFGKT